MNWDRIEGNWRQLKGIAQQQCGRFTEDSLLVLAGEREHLAGKIQEEYGVAKDQEQRQLANWQGQHQKIDQAL